jgi:hypothetical protein
MEIHSSSLSFVPNRVEAKKKNDNQQSTPSDDGLKNPASNNPQSLEKSTPILKVADVELLSNDIESLKSPIKNVQSNRALNAYIQENIQPLKNQRSELVSRIDFYV